MLFINAGNRYIFCNFSFRNDHEQNEQLVARPRHGQSTARQNRAAWRVSEIESCRESNVSIIFFCTFSRRKSCQITVVWGPGKLKTSLYGRIVGRARVSFNISAMLQKNCYTNCKGRKHELSVQQEKGTTDAQEETARQIARGENTRNNSRFFLFFFSGYCFCLH